MRQIAIRISIPSCLGFKAALQVSIADRLEAISPIAQSIIPLGVTTKGVFIKSRMKLLEAYRNTTSFEFSCAT